MTLSRGAADVTELLTRLVEIDSVNPSLVPGAAGERRIADYIAGWARRAGLGVLAVDTADGRPSLLVSSRPTAGTVGDDEGRLGRTLLLCGHLDTVGFGRMREPLSPRVDGDRLYGRGAYDMKAGLAAALVACRDAAAAGLPGRVVVAAVADEEHASTGMEAVLPHVRADAAIVTEPTELTIATAHKGFVWSRIEITGRAAHGSRPHLGVDAILAAGPVLVALRDLDRRLAANAHPMLGPGSLHASLIEGGIEESTIPDRCVLTVERRTLPGEDVATVEADLGQVLQTCRAADPSLDICARTTLARDPMQTDPAERIVRVLRGATGAVLRQEAELAGASYWADSALISAAGIPTVLFGPGGEGAHADVEWVSLSDTIACADSLTATAGAFCS